MKIFWNRPSKERLDRLLENCRLHNFSYSDAGSTRDWSGELFDVKPNSIVEGGYLVQRRRAKIGQGKSDFRAASVALREGLCFDLPWVRYHCDQELSEGVEFCVIANAYGLRTASVCRVIYIDSEETRIENSLSIGIGTLPIHAAIGEEKLSVNWNKESGDVDVLIGSYSKPSSWFSWLFAGYLRRQQDRFARDSVIRMKSALDSGRLVGSV